MELMNYEFLLLPTADGTCAEKWLKIPEFLAKDMKGKLIVSIHLPQRKGYIFRSFKVGRI